MDLRLSAVIRSTIINQIIIQIDWGITIKISENFERSELGHTLKSSIIKRILATHRNCRIIVSYDVYFARVMSIPARISKITKEITELNQNIQTVMRSPDTA